MHAVADPIPWRYGLRVFEVSRVSRGFSKNDTQFGTCCGVRIPIPIISVAAMTFAVERHSSVFRARNATNKVFRSSQPVLLFPIAAKLSCQ